ncbi:MAG: DUF3795 domain-containing protein [Candidatus Thorarchaeota archaeon]|nr:MAG: DUF3795 domain-containing protein [Candidatus Thorarchaeota archaeon]
MREDEITEILAPCGLDCKRCVAYLDGDISDSSMHLKELLGNFDAYAERYSRFFPVFSNYPAFKEMLQKFIDADCPGCRNGHPLYPNCGVATCPSIESKDIDFCFQCDQFPCDKPQFHPSLDERWRKKNKRMAEVGTIDFYAESLKETRYP